MKKKTLLLVLSIALIITACAGGPPKKSKAERMRELAELKTQIAIEFMKNENYRTALTSINEAIAANKQYDAAWMVKALIYQTLKVNDKADQSYRQALSISPSSAEINNNYGWFVCDALKKHSEANIYFDKALADPTYPSPQVAYMNKGICAGKAGNRPLAEQNFNKARAIAPWFAPTFKEMARLEWQQGQAQRATELFNLYQSKVEALNADDLLLGWHIAQSRGDVQAAYEYEAQLRGKYPYSDEMQSISSGN